MTWRAWAAYWRGGAAYAGLGCTAALGFRGDWAAARLAGACVLLIFAAWVRRELLATRARMRAAPEMAARVADAAAASRAVRIRGHAAPYTSPGRPDRPPVTSPSGDAPARSPQHHRLPASAEASRTQLR